MMMSMDFMFNGPCVLEYDILLSFCLPLPSVPGYQTHHRLSRPLYSFEQNKGDRVTCDTSTVMDYHCIRD